MLISILAVVCIVLIAAVINIPGSKLKKAISHIVLRLFYSQSPGRTVIWMLCFFLLGYGAHQVKHPDTITNTQYVKVFAANDGRILYSWAIVVQDSSHEILEIWSGYASNENEAYGAALGDATRKHPGSHPIMWMGGPIQSQ